MALMRPTSIVPRGKLVLSEAEQRQSLLELERMTDLWTAVGDLRAIMSQVSAAARFVPDARIVEATAGCAKGLGATLVTINGLRTLLRFGESERLAELRTLLGLYIEAIQKAPNDGGRQLRQLEKNTSGFSETLDTFGKRQGAKPVNGVNLRLGLYAQRFKYDEKGRTGRQRAWNEAARECAAWLNLHAKDSEDREALGILSSFSTDFARGEYFKKNYHDHKANL